MPLLPIPATLDLSDRKDGDEFEVNMLVRRKGDQLEVLTIEGEDAYGEKPEKEEEGAEMEMEMEMDEDMLRKALKGGME